MNTHLVDIASCLCLAVVLGTDVFFTVVGRTALARTSASAVLEVMGHLHDVADGRMPVFGVLGLLGTVVMLVMAPHLRLIAAISLAAQLAWLALYFTIARPINERMTSAVRTGESIEVRQLQARWESILIARSALMAIAQGALLLALTTKA